MHAKPNVLGQRLYRILAHVLDVSQPIPCSGSGKRQVHAGDANKIMRSFLNLPNLETCSTQFCLALTFACPELQQPLVGTRIGEAPGRARACPGRPEKAPSRKYKKRKSRREIR